MRTAINHQYGLKTVCEVLFATFLYTLALPIHADTMLYATEIENPSHISTNGKAGDVNNDGELSLTDVLMIVDYILDSPSSDFHLENADLDGDGEISLADILILIDYILNPEDETTPKPNDGDANPYLPVLSPRHY